MDCFLLVLELEHAFLPPFFRGFKFKERAFGITGVETESLGVINFKAVNPNVHLFVEVLHYRSEVCNLLMDNEPRVKEQLSGSINLPDPDSLVS